MILKSQPAEAAPQTQVVAEHILEIVSDSGEGAQSCGSLFALISAKMGGGVWTVEIIPAEIEPPHRSRQGASGIRIRIGSKPVNNAGDQANLAVAFNEQVLYSRIDAGALGPGTIVILDSSCLDGSDEMVHKQYRQAAEDFRARGFDLREIPIDTECRRWVDDPRKGKNIWVLGLLCAVYDRDLEIARGETAKKFKRKGQGVVDANLQLLDAGYNWALENIDFRFRVPAEKPTQPMVVMNGNQAIGLGAMAAGMEVCSMYPITPATSVSHFLASFFEEVGGFVHQAEDEIAAVGFAIGASYAGKTALTVTSGPGLALKTEFLGLAVMAEIPLVVIVVQRGGPSTGLPTKIEQGDLMAALHASPGDAPKVVLAPATIEECFHFTVTARKLAEELRGPVMVLTDANLATGQQPFPRPVPDRHWQADPIDQSDWDSEVPPYAWHPDTGLSERPIPGQRGGEFVVTGLAHDEAGHVAYDSAINQRAMTMRSRKLAVLQSSLKTPEIHGDPDGDLLVVGWGSTLGSIEEAVDRLRAEGAKVSSLHLRFLSPLEPGLKEIFQRFRQVLTVEINYSDPSAAPFINAESRRYSQMAQLLRSHTLVDVDCWSQVPGSPLPPATIAAALRERLERI